MTFKVENGAIVGERLFEVPRAAALRIAQARHDFQEAG